MLILGSDPTEPSFRCEARGAVGTALGAKDILSAAAVYYGIDLQELTGKGKRGLEARNLALWLMCKKCGLNQRQSASCSVGCIPQRSRSVFAA